MTKNIRITNIRKTVCTMANTLRKTGLTLSAAFKEAWIRVKQSMTVRAAGVTFSNSQEKLAFLRHFQNITLSLVREPGNRFDGNAIKEDLMDIQKEIEISENAVCGLYGRFRDGSALYGNDAALEFPGRDEVWLFYGLHILL